MNRKGTFKSEAMILSHRSPSNPAEPLRHERQELFAQAYAAGLNPKESVRQAGYRSTRAPLIVGRLLSVQAIHDRIQFLQNEEAAGLDAVKLVQKLHIDQRELIAKSFAVNPFTGAAVFDLGRLSGSEIAGLQINFTSRNGHLGYAPDVSLRSDMTSTLAALGRLVGRPDYQSDRREKSGVAEALRDIARRNCSAAPLRRDYGD